MNTPCAAIVVFAILAVSLSACAGIGLRPSHGTGAADLGATQGFGLGASNEGSLVNQAAPGPGVFEFGGGN